jgi:hypothetical protein
MHTFTYIEIKARATYYMRVGLKKDHCPVVLGEDPISNMTIEATLPFATQEPSSQPYYVRPTRNSLPPLKVKIYYDI